MRTPKKFLLLPAILVLAMVQTDLLADKQPANEPEIFIQTGHRIAVTAMTMGAKNKYILSKSDDNTVRLWDLTNGKEVRHFKKHTAYLNALSMSQDGNYALSGSYNKTVSFWELETGQEVRSFKGHTGWVRAGVIGAKDKYILSGSDDNTVRLWDIYSGKEVCYFIGHKDAVRSVDMSRDGKYALSGSDDNTVRLWDIYSRKEVRCLRGHKGAVTAVAISKGGRYTLSGGDDCTVRLWDTHSCKEVRRFNGHKGGVTAVAISKGGRYAISGSNDHTLCLWDIKTGKEVRRFQGHMDSVTGVAMVESNTLVSAGRDGEIKVWHKDKGEPLVSFVGFEDGEWVVYTPDNYYTCSPGGEKYVTFRVGNEIYDANRFSEIYHNQQAVTRALKFNQLGSGELQETTLPLKSKPLYAGQSNNKALDLKNEQPDPGSFQEKSPSIKNKQPDPDQSNENVKKILPPRVFINYLKDGDRFVELVDNLGNRGQTVAQGDIQLVATVVDQYFGIRKIKVQVNGKTVAQKEIGNKKEYRLEQKIKLPEKDNRIEVIAYNNKGIAGYSEEFNLVYEEELQKGWPLRRLLDYILGKSRGWAVVIGINDYSKENNGFEPLPYGVRDAEAVKKFLIDYMGFEKKRIVTIPNREATKKRIEDVLGKELPEKVREGDRVIVYFSGHGDQEKGSQGKRFGYLIPIDGKKDELYSTCVAMNDLQYFSDRLAARQVLFILDSCFSGIAGNIYKKGTGKMTKDTRKQVEAFAKSRGRQIMTAGGADETTTMSSKWNNHSVYTYYLLKGLKGAADHNDDGVISVRELQVYLDDQVPKAAKQTPQLFNLNNHEGQFIFYQDGDD